MEAVCHYAALGVRVDASAEEIKAAYFRALGRFKHHHAAGNPLPGEHLDTLLDAYRTLSEPAARADYDRRRSVGRGDASAPTTAAKLSAEATDADRECAVEFRGEGGEYLRIWLVNIALSALTLGIYSAWAKVRREKYFHRNFVVDEAAFDYHGNAKAILFGRIVLVVLLAILNFAEAISPFAHLFAAGAAAFAVPWLIVRSLQFRARNTSYRGVRFAFTGTYREALTLYLGHGLLTAITLGLYFPAFLRHQKAFLAGHLRYGTTPCTFACGVGAFYRGLKLPLVLWLTMPLLLFVAMPALGSAGSGAGALFAILIPVLLVLLVLAFNLILLPSIRVVGTNLLWNHTRLGETRFCSTQTVRSYLNLIIANWLLTLLTLGFYWPVAQVRMAAYRARHLTVINPRGLATVAAAGGEPPAAVGDELSESFDFDIAL